ncbi:MAG: hypothetical protein E6X21_02050 [Clostridium sp.]|uniref:hypothetical protein n=1 Tax=Clostridium sp. TaxID=1506 RepID=UPI0029132CAF|nr:hypothetical protein [Clostridium sp.]
MRSDKYERIEITFNKDDPEEIILYEFVNSKSNKISRAKYLKNLIRKEMRKAKK